MSRQWTTPALCAASFALAVVGLIGQFLEAIPSQLTIFCLALTVVVVLILALRLAQGDAGARQERTDLKAQALTDSLTELRNTRAFHEDLAQELAVADARGKSVGLVLLDLDGLKTVNDSAGHQAGDQLIAALAETIRQNLRHRDTAYRIGGDEFAVILRDETTWGAFRFAQRLQGAFGARPAEQRLSAAAGVSASHGQTRDELVREADLALIAAKRSRRGALIYTDDLAVREQGYDNADRIDHQDLVSAALARAVDARGGSTVGSCEAVAELAARMAEALGSDRAEVRRIRRAALLHNVGALGASGNESSADTVARSAAIAQANGLSEESGWIASQNECWDGSGEPAGQQGAEIPVPAMIIRLATTFVGLIDAADDPEHSQADALAELNAQSGVRFMPAVVDALCSVTVVSPAASAGAVQ